MTKLLLIAGLTLLYYVVLIWLDKKGRKAFKAKQQAIMAETAELPTLEKPAKPNTDLLGATSNSMNIDTSTLKKKEIVRPLQEPIIEQIVPKKQEDLVANLAATTDITSIREEETMAFINSLNK